MSLLGVILNILSIIFFGDYNPVAFPDGDFQEDSMIYLPAYHIATMIGTL